MYCNEFSILKNGSFFKCWKQHISESRPVAVIAFSHLLLVIDIAAIRAGTIAEKKDNPGCHRTIQKKNKMDTGQQTAAGQYQSSASAGREAGVQEGKERLP